jgi:hypothetical protein
MFWNGFVKGGGEESRAVLGEEKERACSTGRLEGIKRGDFEQIILVHRPPQQQVKPQPLTRLDLDDSTISTNLDCKTISTWFPPRAPSPLPPAAAAAAAAAPPSTPTLTPSPSSIIAISSLHSDEITSLVTSLSMYVPRMDSKTQRF